MSHERLPRARPAADGTAPFDLVVTPGVGRLGATAGCGCSSLAPGETPTGRHRRRRDAGAVAGGRAATVDLRRRDVRPGAGATDVFAGVSDFVYVPRDAERRRVTSASGGRFALPSARCERRLPVRYQPGRRRPGRAARRRPGQPPGQQLLHAGAFEADKLIACEVLTPGGNWSSYPPHKHDEATRRRERARGDLLLRGRRRTRAAPGIGYQRVYGHDERRDRRARRGAQRRRRADPARLARPVDGGARLRPLLPQRDGRSRRASAPG